MKRTALLLVAVALALEAPAQYARNVTTEAVNVNGSSSSGVAVPTPSLPDAGKVPAVDGTGTAYELVAVAGTGTVTSVGISAPSIFSVADSPVIAAGTIAISLATQAANLVWAGPATGADAAPTFRALVAADLGSFTLAPSLKLLTLQDATGDTTPLTVRASASPGTAPIVQFQASDNSPLSEIAHDGSFTGNASTASALAANPAACSVGQYVTDIAADGTLTCDTPAGGVTNSAGANVIPKSDGTNLVASAISDNGSGTVSVGTASGTPTAYTFKLAADGTGTNIGAASATILPGIGTGSGAASRLLLGGPKVGSSGAATQTTATPVSIGGEVKADGTESFLNVTGTLPATPSGGVAAVRIAATGAGSAAQTQYGVLASLAAGYTGANPTLGLYASNASLGTGVSYSSHNVGIAGASSGATTGWNTGARGVAHSSSTQNVGVWGIGGVNTSKALNIGTRGSAFNATAMVGGLFSISAGTAMVYPAAPVSTALLADNIDATAPILLCRDNGTTVFSVNDGGGVNLMREVEANTAGSGAPNVLVATESHSVMTNEGATAANYHTLPTAAKGLTYTFVVQDTDGIRVTAGADDTIRVAATVTAAAGYITSSTIGDTVTLVAINAVEWVAVSALGTWTAGP